MNSNQLVTFQSQTIERIYQLVDELAMLSGQTDLQHVAKETRHLSRAIAAEIEGIEESVKEYHGI